MRPALSLAVLWNPLFSLPFPITGMLHFSLPITSTNLTHKKILYFPFFRAWDKTRGQLLQEALNHPLITSVAEQHLRSLCSTVLAQPWLPWFPSLPPSLGSAAGLSPLLPQEVTASTVWHMPQFCFTPLLSSLPLLTSCLSTHSDTHSTLLLWQNWGLQRVSIFF